MYERLVRDNPRAYFPNFQAMAEALVDRSDTVIYSSEYSYYRDERFLPLTDLDDVSVDHVAFARKPGGQCSCDAVEKESSALGYTNLLLPVLVLTTGGLPLASLLVATLEALASKLWNTLGVYWAGF